MRFQNGQLVFVNLDADGNVFFTRQLESIKSKTYDTKFPELKARQLIPVSFDAGPGATAITYQSYTDIGVAAILANYSQGLPRVDVMGKEYTARVKAIAAAYGYSVQDVRAAMMAGTPLQQRKANSAKRAILTKEDQIAFLGDAANGLQGLFSHPNVTDVAIAADGTGSSAAWSTKDATKILRDMNALVDKVIELTAGVETPDTMVLPNAQHSIIANMQMPNTTMTVKQFFLANNPYIKNIEVCERCKGAGASGSDLFQVYRKDPDYVTLEIPLDFTQHPAQEKGLEYEVPCEERCAGVIIYRPLAMAKGDGI